MMLGMKLSQNLMFPRTTQPLFSSESDALVFEAHHRVANNLALISSFVRMHARDVAKRTEPPSLEDVRVLLEEVGLRIEAVGQLHRRLAQIEGPASIDLTNYLRDIAQSVIASLSFAGRAHLAFKASAECFIPSHAALLVGLAVSELLMNAVKYAHPTGVMGNLLIGCNRAGDAIMVDIADDGVGVPEGFDPMTNGELGLQLVRLLANQLKAQLRFHDTGIGLHVTLSIPVCPNKDLGC
jgi:two-component sensor histidine kinase